MRYFRIFLLHFQDAFTDRSRSFVWLLIPFVNGGFFLLFWTAAFRANNQLIAGWSSSAIITYYLLLIIASALLYSHIEDRVEFDIQRGEVMKYLLKPFPYYLSMFFLELPYRLIQGVYATVFYLIMAYFWPSIRIAFTNLETVLLVVCIFILAFFLTHTYKMLLGMVTFWTKDNKGLMETSSVLILLLAGFNLPLTLLPTALSHIALSLPFAYFMYFPIISLQGKLSQPELFHVLVTQAFWLFIFGISYKIMLKNGLKKFTAVGQ